MFLFAKNKEITSIYLLYIVSLIMNIIPHITISSFGTIILLVVFVATYILRRKAPNDSINHTHYAYLIKTIWIFSLFVLLGILLSYYLGDHTIINNVVSNVNNGQMITQQAFSIELMKYANANKYVFGLIFTPITLHLFYRLGKGIHKARQNLPITNLRTWI